MLVFLLALALDGSVLHINNTGIFQPLLREEVQVDRRGHVYILDYPEAVVHHFDGEGSKLEDIGFKGQGPGGFKAPWNIYLEDSSLYVFDRATNTISVFDTDGRFSHYLRLPKPSLVLQKVRGGWIYGDWLHSTVPGKPSSIFLVDDRFENPRQVMNLSERGTTAALNINSDGEGVFTPVGDTPFLAASPDGEAAYVIEARGFKVHQVDVKTGKATLAFNRKERPSPFDAAWANETLASRAAYFKIKIKADYPDYFPIIRSFYVNSDNQLVFDRWCGTPDEKHNPLVLSAGGEPLPTQSWEVYQRLAAEKGGRVYVTGWDQEREEAFVACIPQTELVSFIEEHPLPKFETIGRIFSN